MPYQAIVESANSMSSLQKDLNDALTSAGISQVTSLGLDYGNSKSRAAIILNTGHGNKLRAQCFSAGGFGSLEDAVNEWIGKVKCQVSGLSLNYGSGNWRAMVLYTEDTSEPNVLKTEKQSGAPAEQEGIDKDISGAEDVSGFDFLYNNGDFYAMYIYTP